MRNEELLECLFGYKNLLMRELCGSEAVQRLIYDAKEGELPIPNHDAAYKNIFPYEFIADTVVTAQTFICFDMDVTDVISCIDLNLELYVWIFTHKSLLRLKGGGLRLDALSAEIDRLLNQSRIFTKNPLELKSVGRFVPINDYQGRVLVFTGRDWNVAGAPKRPAPSNRRAGFIADEGE